MSEHYLALDLGAGSGRVILGRLEEGRLEISQLHSFPNEMVKVRGHLHWDVLGLYRELLEGMRRCAAEHTRSPLGIGVDTWGLDFGLLDAQGNLLGMPFSYRDQRTRGTMEAFHSKISRERLYQLTGLEYRPLYTVFQLYSMVRDRSPQLEMATDLLFIPDIFNYFFTGVKKTEFSFAAGSQLYNPATGNWDDEIFAQLTVPKSLMPEIVPTGTIIGELTENICARTGLKKVPVVAVASHDTSSAVAAVPASGEDFAYLSSGTWSLVGIESPAPIINEKTYQYCFGSQGGAFGTFIVVKNITGLWLLQECRREWAKTRDYGYDELMKMAEDTASSGAVIDPDHPDFLMPTSMPAAIAGFCRQTGQPVPESAGQFVRVIFESLALAYRHTLEMLEDVVGRKLAPLHIVGGGSQNRLLCQFAADATGVPVYAGPVEATAIGNILVQAVALGRLSSVAGIREVVRRSFRPDLYQPKPNPYWDEAYARFLKLKHRPASR